jgi:hypothetical protein
MKSALTANLGSVSAEHLITLKTVALKVINQKLAFEQERAYRNRFVKPTPLGASRLSGNLAPPGVYASRRLGEQRTVEIRINGEYHCVLAQSDLPSPLVEKPVHNLFTRWFS